MVPTYCTFKSFFILLKICQQARSLDIYILCEVRALEKNGQNWTMQGAPPPPHPPTPLPPLWPINSLCLCTSDLVGKWPGLYDVYVVCSYCTLCTQSFSLNLSQLRRFSFGRRSTTCTCWLKCIMYGSDIGSRHICHPPFRISALGGSSGEYLMTQWHDWVLALLFYCDALFVWEGLH